MAFAAVSMMEAKALHDYASEEGGVLLRAATQDEELAERAVRFASSDQEVRYDTAVPPGGVRGVVDLTGMLGEDQAHGSGTKGEFVNTAQRWLRDAVIRGVADAQQRPESPSLQGRHRTPKCPALVQSPVGSITSLSPFFRHWAAVCPGVRAARAPWRP